MGFYRQRLLFHFFTLIWLLFLVYPVVAFFQSGAGQAVLIAGLSAVAVFAGVYVWLWVRLYGHEAPGGIWLAWASLFAIALVLLLANGQIFGALFIYVIAAVSGYISRWRVAVGAVIALTALMSALAAVEGAGIWTWSIVFEGLLVGGVVLASSQLGRTNRALYQAREDAAGLMIAEERLRFARDLHDLLGHSLSVIVLKAELAGKLAVASPERVAAEVADIERVARQALAEVREAVSGYRDVSLSTEIEQARSALLAAGIQVRVQPLVDSLPAPTENVLAWALREGVTNVIRHAGATAAGITLSRHDGRAELELTDDGRGAFDFKPGNGLTGLRERVAGRKGEVEFGPSAAGGFRLRVSVPL
ncbi:MAG: sensor histidine kinase [Candidatus Dormibacteraceae bacterium]